MLACASHDANLRSWYQGNRREVGSGTSINPDVSAQRHGLHAEGQSTAASCCQPHDVSAAARRLPESPNKQQQAKRAQRDRNSSSVLLDYQSFGQCVAW